MIVYRKVLNVLLRKIIKREYMYRKETFACVNFFIFFFSIKKVGRSLLAEP